MTPIYTTFYTPFYAERFADLYRSLHDLGIEIYREELPESSWREVTAQKPRFLRRMLDECAPHPVVWLDADCVVMKKPHLFHDGSLEPYQIAAHLFRQELLGGTLWLNNTDDARAICDEWGDLAERDKNTWEQRHLRGVLNTRARKPPASGGALFFNLPATYCKIFDIMKDVEDPVIEHYQHSRKKRRAER